MKLLPEVSIILTSYNRPQWLRESVLSVIAQTLPTWELLILDDNSSEPVFEAVEDLLTDGRIRFYHFSTTMEERALTCRYATLINFGLRVALGKYVTYLTDDDFYYPERLDKMIDYISSDENIHVVFGQQHFVNEVGKPYATRGIGSVPIVTSAACQVDHNSVLHDRNIAFEVGLWEDGPEFWGHADAVFWTKLNDAGYKFYFINEVLDAHRSHEHSAQNKMIGGKMPYED